MDGLSATQAIRAAESGERGGRTPIVALSAHALAGFQKTCLDAGMDGCLSKPITPVALAQALARWGQGQAP